MNMNAMICKPNRGEVHAWTALGLDLGERVLLLAFYAWFAYRIITNYMSQGSVPNLIYLVSEGIVILLIIIRRTTQNVSLRPGDWILALAGTMLPLLTYPDIQRNLIPAIVAATIMFAGMLVQISAKNRVGKKLGMRGGKSRHKTFGAISFCSTSDVCRIFIDAYWLFVDECNTLELDRLCIVLLFSNLPHSGRRTTAARRPLLCGLYVVGSIPTNSRDFLTHKYLLYRRLACTVQPGKHIVKKRMSRVIHELTPARSASKGNRFAGHRYPFLTCVSG